MRTSYTQYGYQAEGAPELRRTEGGWPVTRSPSTRIGWLTVVLIVTALTAFNVPNYMLAHWAYAVEQGKIQATNDGLASVNEVSHAFRMVANVARPGVVQIRVRPGRRQKDELQAVESERKELDAQREQLRKRADGRSTEELPRDVLLELLELSRKERDLESRREQALEHMQQSAGSGVLFDAAGYILTNNHVIDERTDIEVRLSDERNIEARLIGSDPKTDLAVIKIDSKDLHPLSFGDSDAMEVGDWVLAVGAPFGLSQSVSHGIISDKGRTDINVGRQILYQDFIQTDAAINHGNSGGPLMNLRGEVVGINTAIATEGGSVNSGVAFTIPSNLASKIARALRESGEVARGWLGIQLANLGDDAIEQLGLESDAGALVNVVYVDSPAQKAGLECEDVIVAVNGHKVSTIRRLQAVVADVLPGERANVSIVRDGKRQDIEILLGRQPEDLRSVGRRSTPILGRSVKSLRVGLRTMGESLPFGLFEFGVPRAYLDRGGALVVESTRNDDLEPGELIVQVNDKSVRSLGDVLDALRSKHSGRYNTLEVVGADGESRTVRIRR